MNGSMMTTIGVASVTLLLSCLAAGTFAAPSENGAIDDVTFELNPVASEELFVGELDRDKRSQDPVFASKNAILGFVFGKIDNFIDAKTRFINTLDQTNIAKNKQHNIVSPPPINTLQSLIQAIITPKISAITSTIGSLSGGLGGAFGGSSGGGGGGNGDGNSASAGLGGIVSSVLRLSGPILSSSAGGGSSSSSSGGGGASVGASVSATATVSDGNDSTTTEEDTPY